MRPIFGNTNGTCFLKHGWIHNVEVVVSQWKGSSSLTWVQETPEGNRYSYILSTRKGEISLKELTDIAKSYIR